LSVSDPLTTWVFGSSSPLASSLLRDLTVRSSVVCFGRKPPEASVDFVELDFAQPDLVGSSLLLNFRQRRPDGVVFCQRYRPDSGVTDLDAIKVGLVTELGPLFRLIELMEGSTAVHRPLSIVLFSSVAGHQSHPDIPVYYHVLKAATLAACRALSSRLAPRGIRINCLILGEFLKNPKNRYPRSKLKHFSGIEKYSLSGRLCTLGDISRAVQFLLSNDAGFITGQELTIDGGLSLIGAESLIRLESLIE